jgi:MFS family permease
MTVGPLLCAVGVLGLSRLGTGATYAVDVLPPVVVFGLGLSLTVAPLTSTVLAAAPDEHAGLASGVNNAVARVAGLLAVAVLPLVAGLSGEAYHNADLLQPAFRTAMIVCAALLAAGAVLSALFVRTPVARGTEQGQRAHLKNCYRCPVDGPPLETCPRHGPLAAAGATGAPGGDVS